MLGISQLLDPSPIIMCCQLFTLIPPVLSLTLASCQEYTEKTEPINTFASEMLVRSKNLVVDITLRIGIIKLHCYRRIFSVSLNLLYLTCRYINVSFNVSNASKKFQIVFFYCNIINKLIYYIIFKLNNNCIYSTYMYCVFSSHIDLLVNS